MTVRTKTSLVKVILIAFTAFILTGCRIEGTVDYRHGTNSVFSFEVEDTIGYMTKLKRTCESVKIMAQVNTRFIKDPKVEDLTPPGGNIKCKVTSNEPTGEKPGLKEDTNSYRVAIPAIKQSTSYSGFKVKMTIIMPGKVTKANIGKIQGNKVTIDDPNFFSKGISITAEKEGISSASTSSGESTKPSQGETGAKSSRNDSEGSFPAWGWGLVGGGVLAVIAGAWLVLGRKRRTARTSTADTNQTPVVPLAVPQQQPYAPRPPLTHPTPPTHKTTPVPDSAHGKSRPK